MRRRRGRRRTLVVVAVVMVEARDVACFQTKAIFINTTRKKTRCKIDQQHPRLLDRNFRVRIRWRKIVANQLEIDLLSSSSALLTFSTAPRVFSGFSPFPLLTVLVELCYLELSASSIAVISYLLLTARLRVFDDLPLFMR